MKHARRAAEIRRKKAAKRAARVSGRRYEATAARHRGEQQRSRRMIRAMEAAVADLQASPFAAGPVSAARFQASPFAAGPVSAARFSSMFAAYRTAITLGVAGALLAWAAR